MSRTRSLLALMACAGFAATAARAEWSPVLGGGPVREVTAAGKLAEAVARVGSAERGPSWLAWEVPATAAAGNACCFDRSFHRTACRLESKDQGWGSNRDEPFGNGRLLVLARWADGRIERAREVAAGCPLDAGGLPFTWLDGVSAEQSVALLSGLVEHDTRHADDNGALPALAYHAGAAADDALQRLAGASRPRELREAALFWIGQSRGATGVRFLAGVVRGDADPDIREKAIFSISQSDAAGAVEAIVEAAHEDSSPDVRGEALFWLAQTGAAVAPEVILGALDRDPAPEVKEKAIFALTQLPKNAGVPLLVRVVRERRDPDLRKQALFWLGQSEDPRAMDFLESILSH